MSAVINTNIAAIRTHGVYSRNNDNMNAAMTRVATAQKINSPRDNAADWAISEKIRERIRSLNQANQNVQNDTALMKTASGALSNTIDILKTLKERAINAANDSNQDSDRLKIDAEVQELLNQIDTNAKVKFNGRALLDGSAGEEVASSTKTAFFTTENGDMNSLFGATSTNVKATVSWTDANGETQTAKFKSINSDDTLSALMSGTADGTNPTIPFSVVATTANNDISGLTDVNGDAVKASEAGFAVIATSEGTENSFSNLKIEITGGTGVTAGSTYTFSSLQKAKDATADGVKPLTFQVGDDDDFVITATINKVDSAGLGLSGLSVKDQDSAKSAMTTIDDALAIALEEQTKLGAYETRLGYTADNLSTQIENLEASDSAIRDADIAKEMTNYMKYSVLAQASQYMMAQAGQNAFSVLNLLQA